VEKYIKEKGQERRVILIKNPQRKGALANRYKGVHLCDDDTIIVDCDGDDMLADPKTLSTINEIYSSNDVWMTWGSYIHQSNGSRGCSKAVPPEVILGNAFRRYDWIFSHLRTYYAALFKKIKHEDLLFHSNYFKMATDVAVMMPMLEMAGTHSMFIEKVLYIYNDMNSINLHKVNRQFQLLMYKIILTKRPYKNLDRLFTNKMDEVDLVD